MIGLPTDIEDRSSQQIITYAEDSP